MFILMPTEKTEKATKQAIMEMQIQKKAVKDPANQFKDN